MALAWAEDKATQECDLSADSRPVAQVGGLIRCPLSFNRSVLWEKSAKLIASILELSSLLHPMH